MDPMKLKILDQIQVIKGRLNETLEKTRATATRLYLKQLIIETEYLLKLELENKK